MVAGVAHELNTPIGNALTVASTIQSDLSDLKREMDTGSMRRSTLNQFIARADEGLALSLKNLQRAGHLISDFKQVAVDQTSDQRREFDLAEVSSEILNMLQPMLRKSGCQITKNLSSGLVCDSFPGRYGQVLTNLVINATIHAFDGKTGGTISVSVGAADADTVELVVADDGHGMEDHVRARIFDPFFTTKMGQGGSGLGMSISYNIVTSLFGGEFEVSSSPGKGSCFVMRLPLEAPQHAAADPLIHRH